METVPYLDLRAQYRPLRSEVLSALEEICESTTFAQGPATSKFEAEFAAYCGVGHCVSLNSGTSALHLALLAAGICVLPAVVALAAGARRDDTAAQLRGAETT